MNLVQLFIQRRIATTLLALGLGLAGLQEAKDTSLKNLKDVRAYTNLPVLSSIPLLENTMLVRRKRRIAYLAWSAAVIVSFVPCCRRDRSNRQVWKLQGLSRTPAPRSPKLGL